MKKEVKVYLWSIITVTLISMIPLLILSQYDHPSADDFNYSVRTYHDWMENGSILSVIKTAVETSAEYWNEWQGLYTSAFLLALQPAIFGEAFYGITGILMISIIFAGNIIFSVYMVQKVLDGDKLSGAAIGCTMSFLMIQWMPSFVEGLYWYNGAMNYVFFFSLLEVLICISISVGKAAQKRQRICRTIAGCVVGFLVAGGNHVTAFMAILYLLVVAGVSVVLKNAKKYRGNVCILLVTVGGFLFNITSPGTKERQSRFEDRGWSAYQAIKGSVDIGLEYINGWIDVALIVCIIILMPIIYGMVRKFREKTGFAFSYPLVVVILSVGWVCAMFCPPAYAMGNFGAGRLLNVVYCSFVVLAFVDIFYLCGWLQEKIINPEAKVEKTGLSKIWILTACILFVGLILTSGKEAGVYFARGLLKDGKAQTYSAEAHARNELLLNSKGEKVEVSGYSIWPELLYFDDITTDKKDWRNRSVKKYYDLKSIKLK